MDKLPFEEELGDMRALARATFASQEQERRRVASQLHDDISQRLSLVELTAAEVEGAVSKDPKIARGKLTALRTSIGELSRDVRALSHRLYPALLDDLGLASGLRALTAEFRDREGMITDFFEEDTPEVPPGAGIVFYRIAQEAMRNIAQHAGRTHVKVFLRRNNSEIQLQIQDAGVGFDIAGPRHGTGLISMAERARQIGATFHIESSPGQGTRVTVALPTEALSQPARGTDFSE